MFYIRNDQYEIMKDFSHKKLHRKKTSRYLTSENVSFIFNVYHFETPDKKFPILYFFYFPTATSS